MIAGARGNDASRLLVVRKRRDQVETPANFECAGRIVVFVLDVNVESGFSGEKWMRQQRRPGNHSLDHRAGASDVVDCWWDHAGYYPRAEAAGENRSRSVG